jgi:hypothetical protein
VCLWHVRIEWRIIAPLIHTFLADGDPGAVGEDDEESLRQLRNSILIENIPQLHRTDDDIADFFNKLFPGEVRRAEVLIESGGLKYLIEQRQRNIESYETHYAKYRHAWHCYDKKLNKIQSIQTKSSLMAALRKRFCGLPRRPSEPILHTRVGGRASCRRRKVRALPFYLREIEKYNNLIESEYMSLLEKRREMRDMSHSVQSKNSLNCGNGFVEFTNGATKSSGK